MDRQYPLLQHRPEDTHTPMVRLELASRLAEVTSRSPEPGPPHGRGRVRRHRRCHRQGRARLHRGVRKVQPPGLPTWPGAQSRDRQDDRHPCLAGARVQSRQGPARCRQQQAHGSQIATVHPQPAQEGGSLTAGPQCRPTGPVPQTTRAGARALNRPCLRISGRADRDERQTRPRSDWCVIQVGR